MSTYKHRGIFKIQNANTKRSNILLDAMGDDSYYFKQNLFVDFFNRERERAYSQNVPVTFLEGDSIYYSYNGVDKYRVKQAPSLFTISCKSFKIK